MLYGLQMTHVLAEVLLSGSSLYIFQKFEKIKLNNTETTQANLLKWEDHKQLEKRKMVGNLYELTTTSC